MVALLGHSNSALPAAHAAATSGAPLAPIHRKHKIDEGIGIWLCTEAIDSIAGFLSHKRWLAGVHVPVWY